MTPTPGLARLYCNVSLIDCESKEVLDELLVALAIDGCLVQRISDRSVVVNGSQRNQVARAFARLGQPHRIVDLAPVNPETLGDGRRG